MAARSRDADRTVGGMVLAVLGAILAVHTLWRLSASLFVIDPRGAVVTVRLQRAEREGGTVEDWLAQAG